MCPSSSNSSIATSKPLLVFMLALCLPTTLSYAAAAVVDVRPPPNALGKAVNGVPIAGQVIISLPTYKPSTATAQTSHQKDSEPSESIISGQTNRRATVVASATASGEVDLVELNKIPPKRVSGSGPNNVPAAASPAVHPKRATSSVQSIPPAKTPPPPSANAASSSSKNAIPIDDKPSSTTTSSTSSSSDEAKSVRGTSPADAYECPKDEYFQLFPTRCAKHSECKPRNGDEFRCCKQIGGRRCVKAVARPLPEPKHEPILGVIPRKCPREPLAELFWDLQTCDSDRDCWPRVCCPDGARKYCRTAQPELEKSTLSVARQLSTPLESVSRYIQCTPPPPAVFDQFPKKCNSTLDCFPNVCCQEAGRKHCRPPRRSLLSLLTGFASRFNTGIIRQWTQGIVIR